MRCGPRFFRCRTHLVVPGWAVEAPSGPTHPYEMTRKHSGSGTVKPDGRATAGGAEVSVAVGERGGCDDLVPPRPPGLGAGAGPFGTAASGRRGVPVSSGVLGG